MQENPFNQIPKGLFIGRVSRPCSIILGITFLSVGLISVSQGWLKVPADAPKPPLILSSFTHYKQVVLQFYQVPTFCWNEPPVNDFQIAQCRAYWRVTLKLLGLALFPWAATGLYFLLAYDRMKNFYRKAQALISNEKPIHIGTVTYPARLPPDSFSEAYCLRPLTIELKNKAQMKVYVSSLERAPQPGTQVQVFSPLQSRGGPVHLAIPYVPHVAVIRGE